MLLFAGLLATILIASACGSDVDFQSAPVTAAITTPGLPYEYTGPDGVSSTVESAARIVTLSGDFSEIVSSLGLGENFVGVDLSSVFPAEEMGSKPKVGVEFRLFAEPILALDPTVVIGDVDARCADPRNRYRRRQPRSLRLSGGRRCSVQSGRRGFEITCRSRLHRHSGSGPVAGRQHRGLARLYVGMITETIGFMDAPSPSVRTRS